MVQKKDHFDLAQVVKYPYLCTRVRQLVAMVHTTPLNGRAPNASALRSDYRYTSSPPEKEKNINCVSYAKIMSNEALCNSPRSQCSKREIRTRHIN